MTKLGRTLLAAALGAVVASGGQALAKKGGGSGGGGGDPGNTTPLDILFTVSDGSGLGTLYAMQDDGSGATGLAATRGGATWSPDGTQVAFYGLQDGYGIYVMDVEGGTPVKLIALQNLTAGHLDWCPVPDADGAQRLAFTSRDESGTSSNDVFVARFDESGLLDVEAVTDSVGSERWLSWSPSGEQIGVQYHSQIHVVDLADRDAEGAPTVHVVYSSTRFSPGAVTWARTSDTIAFSSYDGDHASSGASSLTDVFTIGLSHASGAWTGSAPTNVTNSPQDEEGGPSWSPDDSKLAVFDAYWRKGAGTGSAKTSIQVLDLATGSRQSISTAGDSPVWKRSDP